MCNGGKLKLSTQCEEKRKSMQNTSMQTEQSVKGRPPFATLRKKGKNGTNSDINIFEMGTKNKNKMKNTQNKSLGMLEQYFFL